MSGYYDDNFGYWYVMDDEDMPGDCSNGGRAMSLPNARLIAAAPELYEALANLIYVLEVQSQATRKNCADEITGARAALAKARGETND